MIYDITILHAGFDGLTEDDVQGPDEQPNLDLFDAADFDAYLPNKWNSNMYTLERRRVKTKLEGLGRQLDGELTSAGLSLIMHSSDEFPSFWNKKRVDSQWLFFSRSEAAREELTHLVDKERTLKDTLEDPTPLYRHLFLGLSLTESHLEIGLRLHHDAWVDRKNFLNLCAKEESRTELETLLGDLPGHYQLSTDETNLQTLEELQSGRLSDLAAAFDGEKTWLFIGARLPRDQVLVLEEDIGSVAREVFRSLIPIYKFIAWSPANDAISIETVVKEHNEALQKSRETLDRERAEREARLREQEALGLAMKEQIAEKIRETEAWRSREVAARRAAAVRAANAAKEENARAKAEEMAAKLFGPKPSDKAVSEPTPPKDTAVKPFKPQRRERAPMVPVALSAVSAATPALQTTGGISVGAFVEVTKGFLKGRRGRVQEIDEKGGLKVAFGALSSRLEEGEVTPIDPARERESFAGRKKPYVSKHRR
jgi:hypothetical protein